MSTQLYIRMLRNADAALQRLLPEDQEMLAKKKLNKDVEGARVQVSRLYLVYGQVMKELDVCYFQMVHPQKRILVRKLLDLCTARMLELRVELTLFHKADTFYLDDVLKIMHMTTYDEKMGALWYYTRDRDKELQARVEAMDATEAKIAMLAETRAAIDELGGKIEELNEQCVSLDQIDEAAMAGVAAKVKVLGTIEQMLDALEQGKGSKEAVDRKLQDVGTWRIMVPQYEGTPEEVAARAAAADHIHKQLAELAEAREAVQSIDRQPDPLPAVRAAVEEVDARLDKLAAWRKALHDFDHQLAVLTYRRVALDDPDKKRGAPPIEDDEQPVRKRRVRKGLDDEEEEEVAADLGGPTREQLVAEAIALIQRHERARQGRGLAVEGARLWRLKQRAARGEVPTKTPAKVLNAAATQIQRVWRGYSTRKWLKRQEERRRVVMSEVVPSWRSFAELQRVALVYEHRRGILEAHFRELEAFIAADLERYERRRWPWLLEQYCDEIRAWFQEWYEKCKIFPDFPDEEDGGTLLLVLGQVMTPEEYLEQQELKRLEALKTPKEKEKERKEKEKQKKKEKEAKKKQKEKEKAAKERLKKLIAMGKAPIGFKPKPSKVMPEMEITNEEFGTVWRWRDDTANALQRLEEDMAQQENRPLVEVRIRQAADVMMRVELEQLEEALKRDNKGKGRKKKQQKKKKKKRGGRKKDLTKNRTTESLFEELYAEGVIRRYEPAHLSDFFGEISLNAYDYRLDGWDPPGAPGDIRHVIRDYCMLPMGSELVHRIAPLVRSVCILGPPQSGKKLLARAVCTELGAVMFDLTPKNLAGKYPGPKGLKMLLHLIEKMSRVLQPTVLFVDGAEKMFYKRVPPDERATEPKKLGTKLPKIVKKIKGPDRVLLLGTCSQPWAGSAKLAKVYDKFVLLPRNDYGTVRAIWHRELMAYHGIDREIDLTGLCQMTVGYTLPAIRNAVHETLTVERRLKFAYEPLHPLELYRYLQDHEVQPIPPEFQKKVSDWWLKRTAIGKTRRQWLAQMAEEREQREKEKLQLLKAKEAAEKKKKQKEAAEKKRQKQLEAAEKKRQQQEAAAASV